MYSVVLLAALATAPAGPNFGVGLHGYRSGCYGIAHGGCQGYGGCYGGSCSGFSNSSWGCYGYGNGGFHGNYTWYGQGYGNQSFSCHGCYGCYGGYSCYGVFTPGMNVAAPLAPGFPVSPGVVAPQPPVGIPQEPPVANPRPKVEETPLPKKDPKVDEQTRARVRIEVPEGGKLFVDGQALSDRACAFTVGSRQSRVVMS